MNFKQNGFTIIELVVAIFVIALAAPYLYQTYKKNDVNDLKATTLASQVNQIIIAVTSYNDTNGKLPGSPGCSNALSVIGISNQNQFGNLITTTCTADVMTIAQISHPELAKKIVSILPNTVVLDTLTGKIESKVSFVTPEQLATNVMYADGSKDMRGDADLDGHSILNVKDVVATRLIDVSDPTAILDPSSLSKLTDLNSTSDISAKNVSITGKITGPIFEVIGSTISIDPAQSSLLGKVKAQSFAASKFIDKDNGAYFVDPNGSSNIRSLVATQSLSAGVFASQNPAYYFDPNADSHLVGLKANVIYTDIFESPTNSTYAIRPAGNSTLSRLTVINEITGIYFDSDNSSYFINPSGQSMVHQLIVYQDIYAKRFLQNGSSNFYFDPAGNSHINSATIKGGLISTTFYDNDNGAYYLDPSSSSNLNAVNVSKIEFNQRRIKGNSCSISEKSQLAVGASGEVLGCINGIWDNPAGGITYQYSEIDIYPGVTDMSGYLKCYPNGPQIFPPPSLPGQTVGYPSWCEYDKSKGKTLTLQPGYQCHDICFSYGTSYW